MTTGLPFGMSEAMMQAIRRFVDDGVLPDNIAERAMVIAVAQQLAEWSLNDLRKEGVKVN
jgi:hypothetical protein